MNITAAEHIADRIADIWPNTKIAHHEWVRALTPDADGHDAYDYQRMTEALDHLSRKQAWPPSIVEVLQAHKDLIPRRPTPPVDPTTAPGLANPDAPADTLDRFTLDPGHCATGLDHVARLRDQMIAQAAKARPGGRWRTHTDATTTPTAAPTSDSHAA